MSNKKHILFFLIASLFLGACMDFFDREVNAELPFHSPKMVINSIVNEKENEVRVVLSRTVSMTDTASTTTGVVNPDLEVFVNKTELNFIGFDSLFNQFVFEGNLKSGDEVGVHAKAEGLPDASGSTLIPNSGELLSARLGGWTFNLNGGRVREVIFRLKDVPDEDNFYMPEFAIRRISDNSPFTTQFEYSSPLTFLSAVRNGWMVFSDNLFKNGEIEIILWVSEQYFDYDPNNFSMFLILNTIDKNHYEYHKAFLGQLRQRPPDLFSGEPLPVISNINNGFGLVGSFTSTEIVIED